MFIRTKKTPNSPKTAVQLVQAVRCGNTVKQKIIRHFGYALNEEEIKALKKLALHYKMELEAQANSTLFDNDSILAMVEQGAKQAQNEEHPLPVNLRDVKEEKRIVVGIHHTYGSLFNQIGFSTVVKNPSRHKASVKTLLNIVMARIAKPVSKRSSVFMLEQEYGIKVDVNAVYRMMDLIDDHAIAKTKELAYQYTKRLLEEEVNVIFYDCTTLYFESFIQDDLKQNGYSKDSKFNQSQIVLALMVTQQGLPISYQLYEGSKFEGHTLDDALQQLHLQYKIGKLIFVADSALLSSENIQRFAAKRQPFIVGARLKNMSKEHTRQILNKELYRPVQENDDEEEACSYQEILLPDGLRLIVTYSPRRAAKDKHDREKAIEALSKRIAKSPNPLSLLNNFGYKKFVQLEGKAKLVADQAKIKQAEQWDGLHGIITNITAEQATVQTLLQHYKGLWQIEETFRISKHNLRMRPIFHWTERRIKAHIAICYMALVCMRVLEYKVRLQYKKLSPAAIRNHLLQLEVSILKDYKTQKQYALPSKATQDAKKIYQLLGLKYTDTPYQIK